MQRQFGDILLGSIELFCLAAETGGFTSAALAAGVTPAAVSRSISRLEKRLGLRLFVRTTRSVRLTDAGRSYFAQCRQALAQLAEAEREVMGQQAQPSGTLRISVPTTYGHHRILPMLPAFRERFPDIRLHVHLSNRNIDFVEEGYDMAVRVRAQPDSTLIARHLEDAALVVVATRGYLKKAGTPRTLDDLAAHECIQFELPSSGRLQLLGRRARRRDARQERRRAVPDLSLRRGEGDRRRLARRSAQALRGPLTAVHAAVPGRAACAAAHAGVHRFSAGAAGCVIASNRSG
jgi:DNA-binding transcriptional LysR family regulator